MEEEAIVYFIYKILLFFHKISLTHIKFVWECPRSKDNHQLVHCFFISVLWIDKVKCLIYNDFLLFATEFVFNPSFHKK